MEETDKNEQKGFDFKACLVSSWSIVRDHWPALIAAAFVRDLLSLLAACIVFALCINWTDVCIWAALATKLVVGAGFQCGYLTFCRTLKETNRPEWKELFSGFPLAMDMVFATVCLWCGLLLGLILLVVPAFIIASRWSLYCFALVDQKLDSEKCLAASHRMLKGYGWPVAGLLAFYCIGMTLLSSWWLGFEALFVIALWDLYGHIRAKETAA